MAGHLTGTYDGAWMFALSGGPMAALECALEELNPERAKKVRLLPLDGS